MVFSTTYLVSAILSNTKKKIFLTWFISNSLILICFILKKTPENNILNRKSAFQPVSSSESNYSVTQQILPSTSSGASSTTSSISSTTITSNCISNSNSTGNSINCSKSNENITDNCNSSNIQKFQNSKVKSIPESIRSGSVSSARSIYELRLKRYATFEMLI